MKTAEEIAAIQDNFIYFADGLGMCLDIEFFTKQENPYLDSDTRLAYGIWLKSIKDNESDIRKDERKKSAELYKALKLKKIVNQETVYNAILKGER